MNAVTMIESRFRTLDITSCFSTGLAGSGQPCDAALEAPAGFDAIPSGAAGRGHGHSRANFFSLRAEVFFSCRFRSRVLVDEVDRVRCLIKPPRWMFCVNTRDLRESMTVSVLPPYV